MRLLHDHQKHEPPYASHLSFLRAPCSLQFRFGIFRATLFLSLVLYEHRFGRQRRLEKIVIRL